MKRWIALWKLQTVALIAVAIIVSFSTMASAAPQRPYEYTFVKDAGAQFNGIDGVKKIKMKFYDKSLSASDIAMGSNVYVLHGGQKVDILQPLLIEGNDVTIAFKNLEFLDFASANLDYEVVIEKDAKLHFDQLETYRLPFKLYEILPGFESVFINTSAETVNLNVLKNNSYRDIKVYIPKIYLTGIETIHRYKGVADPGAESHSMTNMDVQADAEATRLTVSVNDEEQYARDLDYRTDVKGFTMGQAGLEALVCPGQTACTGTAKDFHLTAYNQFGKVLTNRNFKIRVTNQTSGYKVNDYIPKADKIFGQQTTVYNLMQDPKLLQTIASQMPVTELDKLGIIYTLGSSIKVENIDQLKLAVANPRFKTIELAYPIVGDVELDRSVTIIGNGHDIVGNVKLGGTNAVIRLKDLAITGDVAINVGSEGAAILEKVAVNGNVTAATGSLHFFNLTAQNGVSIEEDTFFRAASEMRVVNVGSQLNLQVNTSKNLLLIGTFGDIYINNPDAKIEIKRSTDVAKFFIQAPNKLTLTKPRDKAMPPQEGDGTIDVIDKDPVVGEEGQLIREWYYPEFLTQSSRVWREVGVRLTFDQAPPTVEWKVVNPQVFGGHTEVVWNGHSLHINNVTATQMKEVVLQGTDGSQVYRVTILVEVDVEQ